MGILDGKKDGQPAEPGKKAEKPELEDAAKQDKFGDTGDDPVPRRDAQDKADPDAGSGAAPAR